MSERNGSIDVRWLVALMNAIRLAGSRAVCALRGHRRSIASVHAIGQSWYSWCERCRVKLVRVGPGIWRALAPEEPSYPEATAEPSFTGEVASPAPATTSVEGSGQDGGYSVDYFARKHGITREQARELIERIGADRNKLNAAAAEVVRSVASLQS